MPRGQSVVTELCHAERIHKVVDGQQNERRAEHAGSENHQTFLPVQNEQRKSQSRAEKNGDWNPLAEWVIEDFDDRKEDDSKENAAMKSGHEQSDIEHQHRNQSTDETGSKRHPNLTRQRQNILFHTNKVDD